MTFTHPGFLPVGIALAMLVVLTLWLHARRRRRLAMFLGGSRAVRRLSRSDLYRLRLERMLLLALATLAVAGAAAEPRWQDAEQTMPARSVVIALDVSASMQASDVSPTRLARAVEVAGQLVETLGTDRVGLLLFAGSAYPLASPTPQSAVLQYFLSGVTPTMASAHDPGTLLSVGIREAAALWTTPPEPDEERSIVLISDGDAGEDEGAVVTEALAAAGRGIRIYVVGVGTEEGSGMVMPTATYQLGGPVLEASGAPAVSKLNEDLLESVVRAGGGRYVHAADDGALEDFKDSLRIRVAAGPWWSRYDVAYLLILAALGGLLIESMLDVRLPGWRDASVRREAA
jgi:Ca-activated chloride channel family protein